MAKLTIIPQNDWDVIKKYLTGNAMILVPESALESMPQEKSDKLLSLASQETVEYNFGGDPDVVIDIIRDADDYAAEELLRGEGDDD